MRARSALDAVIASSIASSDKDGHVGGGALRVGVLHGARDHLGVRGAGLLAEKRLHDEVEDVPQRHESHEAPQQPEGLERIAGELVDDELPHLLRSDAVDLFARQAAGIDRRALEVLVPIGRVVHQARACTYSCQSGVPL